MYAFLLYPLAVAELAPRALLLACRAVLRPPGAAHTDAAVVTERNTAS